MHVHAIGDLHMPGSMNKTMDVFGAHWQNHLDRIAAAWDGEIAPDDVVLVPGDLSWAMRLSEALADFAWLAARPGTKILVRGNHDYWWQSIGKVRAALPGGCVAIQNDCWTDPSGRLAIGGTRLWDVPGLSLGDIFNPPNEPVAGARPGRVETPEDAERVFRREIERLEISLGTLPATAAVRVAMLHYPPTNPGLETTLVTEILERHRVGVCVFGHLHNLRPDVRFDGRKEGVRYALASADYLGFRPVKLFSL